MRRYEFATRIGLFAIEERRDGETGNGYFVLLFGTQPIGDAESVGEALDMICNGDHLGLRNFPGVTGRTLGLPNQRSRWKSVSNM